MIPQLDVFSIRHNEPEWLGPAETLVQALEMARENGAGTYLLFSPKTAHKTTCEVDAGGAIRLRSETAEGLLLKWPKK